MTPFTFPAQGKCRLGFLTLLFGVLLFSVHPLPAQVDANPGIPGPGQLGVNGGINVSNASTPVPHSAIPETTPPPAIDAAGDPVAGTSAPITSGSSVLAALMTIASLAGFLLYQCGLTRAKNSGHTATVLVVGVLFALTGYWIGGFAVQTGGVGDAHAALTQPLLPAEKSVLDHELGPLALGHHWGLMGSSGFFLTVDDPARNGVALLFLGQAALLVIAVAAALGAALERGRLLAVAICAFLAGVLIYPLVANWVWGGGWLAELGREFGLGHGFVDLGGAGVVHETAGTLALVFAVVLGPRHGRFGRYKSSHPIPGHHLPFVLLGSTVLLLAWTATNAFAGSNLIPDSLGEPGESNAGLAAINTLLAATAGLVTSFILAAWQRRRPDPASLCRGLLGGTVASCGCAALIDPWAAFLMGSVASLAVKGAMAWLERARLDDPVGAAAVHGAGGVWGVLALGLFANGSAGTGYNGVTGAVRGLFYGGGWHQLAAQAIGGVTDFCLVYVLGLACFKLVHTILGARADLTAETQGLDWPELGALGYQADVEREDVDFPS